MKLTETRPDKQRGCEQAAYAVRNALAKAGQEHGLNHAEIINATAHAFASLLAGAYPGNHKNQEAVLSMLPDVVRIYIPEWEKIYAEFSTTDAGRRAIKGE